MLASVSAFGSLELLHPLTSSPAPLSPSFRKASVASLRRRPDASAIEGLQSLAGVLLLGPGDCALSSYRCARLPINTDPPGNPAAVFTHSPLRPPTGPTNPMTEEQHRAKQAACLVCRKSKIKCEWSADQNECKRCIQLEVECIRPTFHAGRQKGIKK